MDAERARRPPGPEPDGRAPLGADTIEREVGLEAVVHYACRDRNLLGMLTAAAGIRNLLIITGDPPKMGPIRGRRRKSTSTASG